MFHIFKHELTLIFRDPKFWIPFVVPPIIFSFFQVIAVTQYGAYYFDEIENYGMLLLGCIMAPMGIPLAADSLAGERERNSLELLQLLPINPMIIFWGKFLAITIFPLFFCLFIQGLYWIFHSDIPITDGLSAFLIGFSSILLTNGFTLHLSLRVKTVRAATQLSLIWVIPFFMLIQFFHKKFLESMAISFFTFIVSFILCFILSVKGMKKFSEL